MSTKSMSLAASEFLCNTAFAFALVAPLYIGVELHKSFNLTATAVTKAVTTGEPQTFIDPAFFTEKNSVATRTGIKTFSGCPVALVTTNGSASNYYAVCENRRPYSITPTRNQQQLAASPTIARQP